MDYNSMCMNKRTDACADHLQRRLAAVCTAGRSECIAEECTEHPPAPMLSSLVWTNSIGR